MKKLMMRILLMLLLCFLSIINSTAQKKQGTVKGQVIDSASGYPLHAATIAVINPGDTTNLIYVASKKDGSFFISGVPFGNFIIEVSFKGYRQINKKFTLTVDNPNIDFGKVNLVIKPAELGNVTVKTSWVTINGDTTEFKASYFRTKPNSTAEDLLKKIPGVQVDKAGTVNAQGQKVTRVLVDGKPFFGDDPKTATRNLPTEIIDKVQVIDARTDESLFKGLDDGSRQKVVNLVTKKDRRKGLFGKASIGLGNDGIYNGKGNINLFDDEKRVSFIGEANNLNTDVFPGATLDLVEDETGLLDPGGSGIGRTKSAAVNYNDKWGANSSISGSYRYNDESSINNFGRKRETIVNNDSSLFNSLDAASKSQNRDHKFTFNLDSKFDSSSSLIWRSNLSVRAINNTNASTSVTTKGKSYILNNLNAATSLVENGFNFYNDLLYRHKYAKKGRTLSLNFSVGLSMNKRSAKNYSVNLSARDTLDKERITERNGEQLAANVSYSEPLSAKSLVDFTYSFNYNGGVAGHKTYDINNLTKKYTKLDSRLTNYFKSQNNLNKIGINYSNQVSENLNWSLGLAAQNSTMYSFNVTQRISVTQSFNNLFPSFSLQYNKNRTKNFRLSYNGNTNAPSVFQLQDVLDKSNNVLNYTIGNRNLKQEFASNFNFTYNSFNSSSFKNFLVSITGGTISNSIGNYSIINTTKDSIILREQKDTLGPGAQLNQPVNLSGNINFSGFLNFGFPLKKVSSNINLTSRFSFARRPSLTKIITSPNVNVNDVRFYTNNYTFGETVSWTMNIKDVFDMNFSSSSTYNITRYQGQTNKIESNSYYSQEFSFEPTYSSANNWIAAANFTYSIYKSQSEGYNQVVPLLNASIGKMLLKNKQGELKLTIYDILNQNKSISRVVMDRYIEDTRMQVMKRYFLLTFTYNLKNFKGRN